MRSFTGLVGTGLSAPGNLLLGSQPGAAIKAKKCFFPKSSWVYAFILTCDDKLAVWFKRRPRHRRRAAAGSVPGVCCLYPQSNQRLYNLAVVWWSAGHFVHRFLYRILGYVLVTPPQAPCGNDCPPGVVVGCCPNALPATVHVTFTGTLAALGSVPLSWDTTSGQWLGTATGCGGGVNVNLSCDALSDNFLLGGNGAAAWGSQANSLSCSPLSIAGLGTVGAGPCTGTFGWTVTQ